MKKLAILFCLVLGTGPLWAQTEELDLKLNRLTGLLGTAAAGADLYKNSIGWSLLGIGSAWSGAGIYVLATESSFMAQFGGGVSLGLGLVHVLPAVFYLGMDSQETGLLHGLEALPGQSLADKQEKLAFAERELRLMANGAFYGRMVFGSLLTLAGCTVVSNLDQRAAFNPFSLYGYALVLAGLGTLAFEGTSETAWKAYQSNPTGAEKPAVSVSWGLNGLGLACRLRWT